MQPPPLPDCVWFIHLEGFPQGPCKGSDIRDHVAAGTASDRTPVWREGWDAWKPLGEVAEFEALFDSSKAPPASSDQVTTWYLVEGDEPAGPFSTKDLVAKITSGEVGRDRWLVRNGWDQWRPIVEAEEFRHLLPVANSRPPVSVGSVGSKAGGRTKFKWIAGGVAGLIILMWIFSGSNETPEKGSDPEEAFMRIAREGEQRMRDMDGKACRLCNGSGRTGKVAGCPDCKDPSDLDPLRRSLGTRRTPSGHVIVCSTCGGSGKVAELCGGCGGSGVFVYRGSGR